MRPGRGRLYGLVSVMTLIWALNFIFAKIALRSFPPLLLGPLRAATAAVLLAPVYAWARLRQKTEETWTLRDVVVLSVLGVFGITLNQVFFVLGMKSTSVAHAALVIATTPLQVMLLAAMRGQERITPRKVGGMAVAIGGIAVLNLGPGRDLHGATLGGDLFVLMGSLCFSLYTVFGKEVCGRHDVIKVNAIGYAAGALAGAPLLAQQAMRFDFAAVPGAGWWALAYMALLSSVVCYLIFYYALNHLPASRVAVFSYLQPVIASVAGLAILSEPITGAVAAGGLLVLSGVWITGRG
ncbi:MAG: DMT family transporter [Acidobacteria bacterium]|nr:DMT family transporter [Acidobacteriota bacterium]